MKPTSIALLLACSASVLPFAAYADDYIIDTAVIITNGGAVLDGDDTITVSGAGSVTPPSNAAGLYAAGGNNSLNNSGTVTTSGIEGSGLYHLGDSGTVTNSGLIVTSGFRGRGLFHQGAFGVITNSGTVATSGDQGWGLNHWGDSGAVVNNGTITTSGSYGHGLYLYGDYGTLSNNGTITTSGNYGFGLHQFGDYGTLSNNGTITTSGDHGHGLFNQGVSGTLSNSGVITASGNNGRGLLHFGSSGTLSNGGTITTSGQSGHGLFHWGDSGTITNNGSVIVTGADSLSILHRGSNGVINLNEGSVLVGDVEFSDTGSATLNFGSGLNAVVRVAGAPATITAPNDTYVVVGDIIYAADTTGFSAIDQSAAVLGRQVLGALANRHATHVVSDVEQSTKGLPSGFLWGQFIVGGHYQSGSDVTAAYTGFNGGLVFGREQAGGSGYFGGVGIGRTASTDSDAFDISTYSAFAGLYNQMKIGEFALTVGYQSNASSRQIANNMVPSGIETATASYSSYFVSPSLTMQDVMGLENTILRLRYLGSYSSGYTEMGSSTNLTVDERFSHLFEARIGMQNSITDSMSIRYGVDAQYSTTDATGIDLMGTALSIPNANDGFAARGFLGLDFNNNLGVGNLEFGMSDTGQLDAALAFKVDF